MKRWFKTRILRSDEEQALEAGEKPSDHGGKPVTPKQDPEQKGERAEDLAAEHPAPPANEQHEEDKEDKAVTGGGAAEGSTAPPPVPDESAGLWSRLRAGLSRSRDNIRRQLTETFRRSQIDEDLWEEIETVLIGADVGVETTMGIINDLRALVKYQGIKEPAGLWSALSTAIESRIGSAPEFVDHEKLTVVLVVGVNGTGKTTTIAKLARQAQSRGQKVLLAAADTYRAAAIEQLSEWGRRIGADVIAHQRKADPSAVMFDAVQASKARGVDLLLADTAGRLHTYENLMAELTKIHRVAQRELGGEGQLKVLLVLDATTGQNGLIQARQFTDAVGVDAIALTKLDGTAKGGIVLAIQDSLSIPIAYIGVGEGFDDLQIFDPQLFARAFIGNDVTGAVSGGADD